MECEVKVGQVERPSGLAPVELLGCLEVFQVLVVHLDLKTCARHLLGSATTPLKHDPIPPTSDLCPFNTITVDHHAQPSDF